MAEPGTQPPGEKKKTFPLWLLVLILLLIAYFLYRGATRTPAQPEVAATPVPVEATPSPAAPRPTPAATATSGGTPLADPECKDWLVTVGPDPGTLNYPDICVGPTNHAVWVPSNNAGSLAIFFPISGYPPGVDTRISPFLNMTLRPGPKGQEWVFNYSSGTSTNSGTPNPALPGAPGTKLKWFTYDQALSGKRADGRMIILK